MLHHYATKFKINCAKYYRNERLVVKYCTQYLDKFPSSYSTLCIRAETFGELKRYEEALNDLNHAIMIKHHKPTAWCLRGIIKGLNKSYMEAVEDLNHALYRDENDFLALKWRAFCYYEMHLYNHALWDLNLIINSGCADAFTHLNRAEINRILKNFMEATEDIKKAFDFENINKALAY
ncbi:1706_t:CDS:1 [Diversispora eburnea]|uniref:1706_t:CDS:1 n=1 Tax=Diversispora eburnea TaxID=1213867 RepID=A0A9N9FZQ9_9GLOM|nr:1706_t:CDS:1 [Diversispora eburnea]